MNDQTISEAAEKIAVFIREHSSTNGMQWVGAFKHIIKTTFDAAARVEPAQKDLTKPEAPTPQGKINEETGNAPCVRCKGTGMNQAYIDGHSNNPDCPACNGKNRLSRDYDHTKFAPEYEG